MRLDECEERGGAKEGRRFAHGGPERRHAARRCHADSLLWRNGALLFHCKYEYVRLITVYAVNIVNSFLL